MSNLDPNLYTNQEVESLIQVLLDAFNDENLVSGIYLAESLLHVSEGCLRDPGTYVSEAVGQLKLKIALSQQVQVAAKPVWSYFQHHHVDHTHEICPVLGHLTAPPEEQAHVPHIV